MDNSIKKSGFRTKNKNRKIRQVALKSDTSLSFVAASLAMQATKYLKWWVSAARWSKSQGNHARLPVFKGQYEEKRFCSMDVVRTEGEELK